MDSEFDTEGTADPRQSRTFSDWLVPLVIFAFCGVVTYFALHLDTAPAIVIGEAMQPRSFPIFLMVLIALLNAVLIYQLVNGGRMPHPSQMPQTWITMLLMVVFYGLTTYVDMFVGLMVVIFVMSLVWGERRYWLAAMVAFVTPVTIFFLFDLVLKIRFPRGILTELYYG
ncbi:MAG: tripartite tricarboxylate transporter TctB family protein [Pseudomonadota bacterium]